jgi:hypothetical protein
MRLWSLHPKYLDVKGLVAAWREGLLALHVLRRQTKGYRNHPQLDRFKQHPRPVAAITAYLAVLQQEATKRGYHFDAKKLGRITKVTPIPVTRGQLNYEWQWLQTKLKRRDPNWLKKIRTVKPKHHPSFRVVPGPIASWEKV